MSKKKGHDEEHISEGWLIPYADLLTLLLALFIILFAMSSVDTDKYNAMMQTLYVAFNGELPETDSDLPDGFGPGMSMEDLINAGMIKSPAQVALDQVENLYGTIQSYITANDLSGDIGIVRSEYGVLVTLAADVCFDSGSAAVSPEMEERAKLLVQMIEASQSPDSMFDVVIDGHTDNVPINTAQYPSNWKLSLDRACNFLGAMLENSNIDPSHFSIRGFGEEWPIADNTTSEGRAKNRRVELSISSIILKEQHIIDSAEAEGDAETETPVAADAATEAENA